MFWPRIYNLFIHLLESFLSKKNILLPGGLVVDAED